MENLLDWCEEFDIKIITLYVLSAENLDRKNEELDYLFNLIETRLEKLYNDPRIHKNKMRVKAIGRIELLPDSIKDVLSRLDNVTKEYDNHFLNIAIAYGGQNELVDAVKKIGEFDEIIEDAQYKGYDCVFPGFVDYGHYWYKTDNEGFKQIDSSMKSRNDRDPIMRALYGLGCLTKVELLHKSKMVGGKIGILPIYDFHSNLNIREKGTDEIVNKIFFDYDRK